MANGLPSRLVGVRVYRGRPSPDRQATAAAAADRQVAAWLWDDVVEVIRRPLRYPRGWPQAAAQEKGVDVALAVDLVRRAVVGAYDVGILVSSDSDLLPAVETVADLTPAHIEVAAWKREPGLRAIDGRISPRGVRSG